MTLPSQERCANILKDLEGDPELTQWESDFIDSNIDRKQFTDRQREIIASFAEKYDV